MMIETDGTIRLADEELKHAPKADCACDRKTHPVVVTVDLAATFQGALESDFVTAAVLPETWEKAIQVLHEQAGHATAYAESCREPGCTTLYEDR